MDGNERAIEDAERFEQEERDRRVGRIRSSLCLGGDEFCRDCGDPIPVDRRMALPSATRCIDCQETHERNRRG